MAILVHTREYWNVSTGGIFCIPIFFFLFRHLLRCLTRSKEVIKTLLGIHVHADNIFLCNFLETQSIFHWSLRKHCCRRSLTPVTLRGPAPPPTHQCSSPFPRRRGRVWRASASAPQTPASCSLNSCPRKFGRARRQRRWLQGRRKRQSYFTGRPNPS